MRFRYVVVLAFLLLFANLNAQADCILGVGVTSDSIISDIFQLNEMQHEKLESFSAEIKYRNDILSNELENVKSRHPQSSVTELRQLADKYKVVMDSMAAVQEMIDKKMLALFNSNQYELYLSLCKDASRSAYIVVPAVYTDSISIENR
ncbi:hypothetical protein DFQ03_1438 [Maribacter caenipelagi]|uniref:Periplasmic chaperone for outer membrane proteins Skp n=1 Tax=Maribacter caenipelagi TaxID=1447781 RepID=A0A4R7D700_9FLAO|nr:hypothetical protein [Maribacter caenipelagi]TDS16949.1 hypothetical protein DFQ03_1438 [Maribacter caenipelagi]